MDRRTPIELAAGLARPFSPSADCQSGTVAAALRTGAGDVCSGVCVDTACSLGFCAEHAAVAEMLEARQSEVRMLVAVTGEGRVIPPCGRCRELPWQVDRRNANTWVVLGDEDGALLADLLPRR